MKPFTDVILSSNSEQVAHFIEVTSPFDTCKINQSDVFYLTKDVVFQFSAALTERVLVDEVVEVLATFSGGGSGNNLLPLPKKLDTVACFIL